METYGVSSQSSVVQWYVLIKRTPQIVITCAGNITRACGVRADRQAAQGGTIVDELFFLLLAATRCSTFKAKTSYLREHSPVVIHSPLYR